MIEAITKLTHPFMPFVSEEIYQSINGEDKSLNVASWPKIIDFDVTKDEIDTAGKIIEIITSIRNLRSENKISPSKPIDIYITSASSKLVKELNFNSVYLERFLFANKLEIATKSSNKEQSINIVLGNVELSIPLKGLLNIEEELKRLEGSIAKAKGEIERSNKILSNENFLAKASAEKVEDEKRKQKVNQETYDALVAKYEEMKKLA
jgi:valyl-tRNA synthetase